MNKAIKYLMESVQKVYGFDITDDDYNSNSDLIMS